VIALYGVSPVPFMSFVMPSVICVSVTPGPGTGVGPLLVGVGDVVRLGVGVASSAEPQAAITSHPAESSARVQSRGDRKGSNQW
jgi:hypothetical protein